MMDRAKDFDYLQFIKRFERPDLSDNHKCSNSNIIGCDQTVASIKRKIRNLLDPKSIRQNHALVTGPSKTGKTYVVHRVAKSYSSKKLHYIYLKSSWTLEKQFGNPEEKLRQMFDEAIKKAPSLIFIDRLDTICEKKRYQNDASRVFNVLEDRLECLNGLSARVLVLGATNRPEALESQITCYFSDEIKFFLPSLVDRRAKLEDSMSKINAKEGTMSSDEMHHVADSTHCYSFEDLEVLCCNALEEPRIEPSLHDSFKRALSDFKPVLVRSVTSPCPRVRWEDIGGVDRIKMDLQVSVIWPLRHREQFKRLGLAPIKGILLYGPPGCSKTMLAQALATESGYNFISIKGPELNSKYVGESEAAVRKLYRNAREIAPCIIFFDEIEAMAPERSEDSNSPVGDRVTAQLLTELNGVEPLDNVFTIAATNRPNKVDSALLRPGRLDPAIYVSLPCDEDRMKIFLVHMRKLGQLNLSEDIKEAAQDLADQTEGYSGADIARVCQVAGELALREFVASQSSGELQIERRHFDSSLEQVRPKTRQDQLKTFAKFHEMTLELGQRESFAINTPTSNSLSKVNAKSQKSKNKPTKDTPTTSVSNFFSEDFHKLNIRDD